MGLRGGVAGTPAAQGAVSGGQGLEWTGPGLGGAEGGVGSWASVLSAQGRRVPPQPGREEHELPGGPSCPSCAPSNQGSAGPPDVTGRGAFTGQQPLWCPQSFWEEMGCRWGGEGQGTGSGPTASERQGLLPPRPHLVTWEGRKERVSPRSGDLRGCFHNGPSGGRTLNGQLVSFSAVEMPPCPQAHRTLGPSQGEGGWDRAARGVSPRALLGRKGAQSGLSFPL